MNSESKTKRLKAGGQCLYFRLSPFAFLLCCALAGFPAGAQQFPTKPIRFIAPFPPAGSSDLIARVISQRMGEELGQPVIVDNRPGASGSTGTELCAKAPPDGYTMVLGSIAGLAINPHLLKHVGYDPVKDFSAAAALGQAPQMLVVHPSLPAKTVQEFLALARKKPNSLSCGSGGVGTPAHFGCELVRLRGNAQLLHVPYKGTGLSVTALLGGEVQAVFASMPVAYPHVRAGKLRALASTSPTRSSLAPELPTMIEAGVPGFVSQSWWGAFVPARTPASIVKKLGDTIYRILPEASSKKSFAALGVEPLDLTPAQMMELVRSDLAAYGKIVKEIGITGL
jgi:tripartite-type tricarboxylate transporter receptor subunit TctC